ncbi:hypothetical protein M2109_000319 [Paenibacillus sp. PastH-3]|nr:hypothetical protein [Paenibacillus sp. PastH-4]MDH6443288.1 hypothetical protein [Paenibacillus sp. PastF-4]MDH6526008.1 hypothetical protein [Paenibacillus sp. PastH-3]
MRMKLENGRAAQATQRADGLRTGPTAKPT